MMGNTPFVGELMLFHQLERVYYYQPRYNFGPSLSLGKIVGLRLELAHLREMPEYASTRIAYLDVTLLFWAIQEVENLALLLALSDGLWSRLKHMVM